MLNISYLGGYISQDSKSQNYTGSNYYNSNSDLNSNSFAAASGVNASDENWDQKDKSAYNYYTQTQAKSTGTLLYKTKLWRHFMSKGFCNLGEKWNFAHGVDELRNSQGADYQASGWPTQTYTYQPKASYSFQSNDQK